MIEYKHINSSIVWIKNPFTGTLTYFNDIHKKIFAQWGNTRFSPKVEDDETGSSSSDRIELIRQRMAEEQQRCVFCPGNETLTPPPLRTVVYGDIYSTKDMPPGKRAEDWALRVFHNIIPRIPVECTGGRNESYVLVEDARHYLDNATSLQDLCYTGVLPPHHFVCLLELAVEIMRYSYSNPTVRSVLIRKHQGPESGGSQPHIHMQVLGADEIFPDIHQEMTVTQCYPSVWEELFALCRSEGWVVAETPEIILFWSPFGKFPRSYDVVCLHERGLLTQLSSHQLEKFATALHQVLRFLGPIPLDYEIHHGEGIPIHAHINTRLFPYSNVGGTLNIPSDLAEKVMRARDGFWTA